MKNSDQKCNTMGDRLAIERKCVIPEETVFDVLCLLSCDPNKTKELRVAVWTFLADLVDYETPDTQRRIYNRLVEVSAMKVKV